MRRRSRRNAFHEALGPFPHTRDPVDGAAALHILTKIFIVLTALLTVALVPLVMINTANDETFKKRWLDAQADGKKAIFEKD